MSEEFQSYVPDLVLIQTFLKYLDKHYFVSTFNRNSSCIMGGQYAQTLVWHLPDYPKFTNRSIVDDGFASNSEHDVSQHFKACEHWCIHGLSLNDFQTMDDRRQ